MSLEQVSGEVLRNILSFLAPPEPDKADPVAVAALLRTCTSTYDEMLDHPELLHYIFAQRQAWADSWASVDSSSDRSTEIRT